MSKLNRNPARSRPLSENVKRLMKMGRQEQDNPLVKKVLRPFSPKDYAYCDMQGEIFMEAAIQKIDMEEFASIYMNSQVAGVIDYSFACACGMENDSLSNLLGLPILLKSPETIVDLVLWLDDYVQNLHKDETPLVSLEMYVGTVISGSANSKKLTARQDYAAKNRTGANGRDSPDGSDNNEDLIDRLSYAYWLGYMYRCECLLHEETSRMVFGAFPEKTMREFYLTTGIGLKETDINNNAVGLCRKLDEVLVGNLWNE